MKKKALDLIEGLSQEEIDEVIEFDDQTPEPIEGGAPVNPQLAMRK